MSYFIPDLTGTNPAYKKINLKKRILLDNQVVPFFDSVYLDSIVLTLEGTGTKIVNLVYGVDYTATGDDFDYDAMGRMQLLDNTWNGILVKSVHIIKPFVAPYNISVNYQGIYPEIIDYVRTNPTKNVQLTPEVFEAMINDIANLKVAVAPVTDITASSVSTPKLLEEDPTRSLPENEIVDELYSIDTTVDRNVVMPFCGSFYGDGIRVINASTDKELMRDVDYVIAGPDIARTKATTSSAGVYRFIVFLTALTSDVKVSYHAYGGIPTLQDVKALTTGYTNLYNYITNAQLLTANSLVNTSQYTNIVARLNAMEAQMRVFANQGKPSYGDVTSGGVLKQRITSVDTKMHWWTIAELYKIAGSDTIFTSDISHFQIQTYYTKYMLDVKVACDITNLNNKFNVKSLITTYPLHHVPFEDDSDLENVIRPQLRIIWNENSLESSGIYLQLGFALKTVAEETIAVADLSGPESCFKLINGSDTAVSPEDDIITLPSGNHIWSTTNPDSRIDSYLIPFDHGHVVWSGAVTLNRPTGDWKDTILEHFLEDEIDINKLKSVSLYFEESAANRFQIDLPLLAKDDVVIGSGSFTYSGKAASVVFRIYRNTASNKIQMTLQSEILAGVASTALDLRYVSVNS